MWFCLVSIEYGLAVAITAMANNSINNNIDFIFESP